MSDFHAIADRVEIEALRGEFTDAAMMRDRARLASLFTPDGALRMPNIPAEMVGREEIRAGGERLQAQWDFSVQTTHPGMIQLDGDTATGRAYIQDLARARDGRQGLNFAIYHDRYQRTGEGWKFTERVYEVRYLDTTALAGSVPRAAGVPADPPAANTAAAEEARADTKRPSPRRGPGNADRHHLRLTTRPTTSPGGTMTTPIPATLFAGPAPALGLERAAAALTAHGFSAEILGDAAAARAHPGSDTRGRQRVHRGQRDPPPVRHRGGHQRQRAVPGHQATRLAMDRATSAGEIRRLLASPDVAVGSAAAVTETGSLVIASASGSQLPGYAGGAAARSGSSGRRRWSRTWAPRCAASRDHCLPLESARAQVAYGQPSAINRLLILNAEPHPGAAPSCCSAKPSDSEPPGVAISAGIIVR